MTEKNEMHYARSTFSDDTVAPRRPTGTVSDDSAGEKMTDKQTFTVWIALSASKQPAFFLGYHRTRAELRRSYVNQYGHDLETGGYTAAKVEIRVAQK